MREVLVQDLIGEVLGPRGGVHEVLEYDPRQEYITGILAPEVGQVTRDVDAEATLPAEVANEEGATGELAAEDGDGAEEAEPPAFLSPGLDPKALPRSMGVTFSLEGAEEGGGPEGEICVTWARYSAQDDGRWVRRPRSFLSGSFSLAESRTFWLNGSGECQVGEAEISVHVSVTRVEGIAAGMRATVQVVSRIHAEGDYGTTEEHIFQPQVRFVTGAGTRVVPGVETLPTDEEEEELEYVHRERPVLARGHLCSAIWQAIDPERESPEGEGWFGTWADGELLSGGDHTRFTAPDVRSEYLPMYAVGSPVMSWDGVWGEEPELSASDLSEAWDASDLARRLGPLVEGYERWVRDLWERANAASEEEEGICLRLIERCEDVLRRMREGLDLLLSDEDVRLAFCFANKALDVQSSWSRNEQLVWYPFQLAFVLMTLESVCNPQSGDRDICDLIWVPTGGGKTEAYLAVAILDMALRRRRASLQSTGDRMGAGTAVISRYTLRLLTIQQFRRTLAAITACEYLRIDGLADGGAIGWRPECCGERGDFIWGSVRFSAGLWVGGGVTPNRLQDSWSGSETLPGAISILRGHGGEGEPAQVTNCPACHGVLSIPATGLLAGEHLLHWIVETDLGEGALRAECGQMLPDLAGDSWSAQSVEVTMTPTARQAVLSLRVEIVEKITDEDVDGIWRQVEERLSGANRLVAARAARPGYFVVTYRTQQGTHVPFDFEIHCPNPDCVLNVGVLWTEGLPSPSRPSALRADQGPSERELALADGCSFGVVRAFPVSQPRPSMHFSWSVPIPAFTVDEQIYHRCPSFLVSTVDKFARLSFEPRAGAIFGNVDHHHEIWGYYRRWVPPHEGTDGHAAPARLNRLDAIQEISAFRPPDLVIQDELHLIEGPLGSMVGIYETVVDFLVRDAGQPAKYVASSATVKKAQEQVSCLFTRRLVQFPPPGLTTDDRFFLRSAEPHPAEAGRPGRLYLGVSAPGKGPLTPIVRIWARLMQTALEQSRVFPQSADAFWTITGYFNALRELSGARALYRQDIPQRVETIATGGQRAVPEAGAEELSSRTDATSLPAVLDLLNRSYPDAPDALFTTSMFGTGVDIPRLGLMVVNGQPKTSAAYIQATGRVGRRQGALVVTFLRASRPRDLVHYEFFAGYHRRLQQFVEAVTVMPFSPGAVERSMGPALVAMLRNMRNPTVRWYSPDSAPEMASERSTAREVQDLSGAAEDRGRAQPDSRRPRAGQVGQVASSKLDRWQQVALQAGGNLRYVEYAINTAPSSPVVLGDAVHAHAGLEQAFENCPQSLRDVEETTGFET